MPSLAISLGILASALAFFAYPTLLCIPLHAFLVPPTRPRVSSRVPLAFTAAAGRGTSRHGGRSRRRHLRRALAASAGRGRRSPSPPSQGPSRRNLSASYPPSLEAEAGDDEDPDPPSPCEELALPPRRARSRLTAGLARGAAALPGQAPSDPREELAASLGRARLGAPSCGEWKADGSPISFARSPSP